MPKTKFKSKIEYLYGERCDDYEKGCPICDAWHLYDHHQWGTLLAMIVDVENDIAQMEEKFEAERHQMNVAIDKRINQLLADASIKSTADFSTMSSEDVYRLLLKGGDDGE
jgi:hypothetical protein